MLDNGSRHVLEDHVMTGVGRHIKTQLNRQLRPTGQEESEMNIGDVRQATSELKHCVDVFCRTFVQRIDHDDVYWVRWSSDKLL